MLGVGALKLCRRAFPNPSKSKLNINEGSRESPILNYGLRPKLKLPSFLLVKSTRCSTCASANMSQEHAEHGPAVSPAGQTAHDRSAKVAFINQGHFIVIIPGVNLHGDPHLLEIGAAPGDMSHFLGLNQYRQQ